MAKRLYDVLKDCKKEEEIKAEFCKFFKMKINALKAIDHYTPKIETWDVGYYQICKALKEVDLASDEFVALKTAHDALRAKLLPKVYEYGFLNPDVQYFQ